MGAIDIGTAVVVAFKYRLRAIVVFALCIAAAIAASVLIQTQYEATAQILVKIGRELIYRPDVGNTQAALPTMDKDDVIASNITLMRNSDTERAIVTEIGLANLYPKIANPDSGSPIMRAIGSAIQQVESLFGMEPESPMTQALRKLDGKLRIDTVKKTDVVAVSFMHPDPVLAARVANMVVEQFQKKVGQLYDNPNLGFMQSQVDSERAGLQQAEERLNDFRRQYQVYAFDSQMDLLLKQRTDIDSDMKGTTAHVAELKDMVATLTAQRTATPRQVRLYSDTERHRSIDDAQGQLLTLKLQEKQYAARYNDTYQPLIDLRNQIRLAEGTLASNRSDGGAQTRVGQNDTYQQLDQDTMRRQADLTAAQARLVVLKSQLAAVESAIDTVSSRQRTLQDMQHDIDLRTDAVKTSYAKLVEARAVQGLNQEKPASFALVAAATPPDLADPARPLPLFYTVAAAVVGIFLGALVVFISSKLNDSFVTPAQAVRRLNLPMLAVINYNPQASRLQRGRPFQSILFVESGDRRAVTA